MKTSPHSNPTRGSLFANLIVAIAVVVVLVSLGLGAWKFAIEKSEQILDVELHGKVLFSLEAYKTANSHYPTPAHPEEMLVIDGVKFPAGGAAMLYQVVSGDGSDQILESGAQGIRSDGNLANDDPLKAYSVLMPNESIEVDGVRFLVDSYGHPVQYQKGGDKDAVNKNFDVWFFGGDTTTVDRRDVASKRDPNVVAKWIRNFSLPQVKRPKDR